MYVKPPFRVDDWCQSGRPYDSDWTVEFDLKNNCISFAIELKKENPFCPSSFIRNASFDSQFPLFN